MNKFYGPVGYARDVEEEPGTHVERVTERIYFGDILRNSRRMVSGSEVNSGISFSGKFSILADPYAFNHFFEIRYVKYQGVNWSVTDVAVEFPRLILEVGGIYNGTTAETS